MAEDRYQKGIDKIQELTNADDANPTGFMDIGEAFADIAPDLSKYVVEFAFGDIYSRPGISNKQKVMTTITALVAQGKPQIRSEEHTSELHEAITISKRNRQNTRIDECR